MTITPQHLQYVLRLADTALILGQRNAEWCGHGPILEEDIALSNMSLDLIGQARLLYTHAAALEQQLTGKNRTEDDYAYFRAEREFANYTLAELPHYGPLAGTAQAEKDYAVTIVRNFLYSTLMAHLWTALTASKDEQLAAIAAKSIKETSYHVHHASEWLIRFGDGTDESHRRAQAALDYLLPYTRGGNRRRGRYRAADVGPRGGMARRRTGHARQSHAQAPRSGQAHHDRQAWRALGAHGLRAGRNAKPRAPASRRHLVSTQLSVQPESDGTSR
jgi:phenylacetate-CoA oxygenase PaaI subunit